MNSKTRPLKTAINAFEILELLEKRQKVSPTEVAEEMNVTRSTAHDYLVTLEKAGYAIHNDGEYKIGHRLLGLGNRIKYRNELFLSGKSSIRKLAMDTGEASHLGIEEAGEWVLLHGDGDIESVDMRAYSGLRFPLHTQAPGKVILANLPEYRVEKILSSNSLEEKTEHTITDPEKLRAELDQIRIDGYAVDWDEQVLGVGNIAFPIFLGEELLGSVSIGCPTGKLQDEDQRGQLIQRVKEAADEIILSCRYNK